MKLIIPITGRVLTENPLSGDPNEPIRPIDIDLGNVSWQMVDVDLDNEVMVIEVSPAEGVAEDTGQLDGEGNPIYQTRPATQEEKAALLKNARQLIEGHTKDELYAMTGSKRLVKPAGSG